jgi:hypothetical protein
MGRENLAEEVVVEILTVGEETAAVQTPQKTPRPFATSSEREKKALEIQVLMRMIQPRISRRPRHRRVPESRANKEPPKRERRRPSRPRHDKPKHVRKHRKITGRMTTQARESTSQRVMRTVLPQMILMKLLQKRRLQKRRLVLIAVKLPYQPQTLL